MPNIYNKKTFDRLILENGGRLSAATFSTNVAVGASALSLNTTGQANVAIGRGALRCQSVGTTTNNANVAVGYRSLFRNISTPELGAVSHNTAVGTKSLLFNLTGSFNVAIGSQAMFCNVSGNQNTAVGSIALCTNTGGNLNTAVGQFSIRNNQIGNCLTSIGVGSLGGDVDCNTSLGNESLSNNTSGTNNVSIGHYTLVLNQTGAQNIAVGVCTLYDNTSCHNIGIGHDSFKILESGYYNISIGSGSGNGLCTGSFNIIIGAGANVSSYSSCREIVIGRNLIGQGDCTTFIGGTAGTFNGANTALWNTTSDCRIKKNISDNIQGTSVISKIRVRNFEYREPHEITELPKHRAIKSTGVKIGVIAQEFKEIIPDDVHEGSNGILSIQSGSLTWYMINTIKELTSRIEELEKSESFR